MALKTDITKAYDRLEWSFLEETMKHMGFNTKWISWIMKCVTTVSYSVLINGSPHGNIIPGRGIRQGDPLSPYLFILCAEVLSHMMKQAESTRNLKGIHLSTKSPAISHLLFADDSLFFTLANQRSCYAIKQILNDYEEVSGQAVNLRKSAITFGRHVKDDTKRRMRHLLGIHNEGGEGKYLGLPEQFNKNKKELFHYIVEKVKDKTQGWSKKFLSPGGKEVLLKAVALAMPVYSMNLFKLTKEVCEEINGLLARFWWSSGNDEKGMHWFAWKRLSKPKREGGLGFKDLENFNLALLGKQTWRLLQHPNCLMARLLKGRYYPDTNIMNATQGRKASYVWKSILHGRDLVKKGLRCCIGDGSLINAWLDPWLPLHTPRPPLKTEAAPEHLMVSELFNSNRTDWEVNKLRNWIVSGDIETIKSIKLCSTAKDDLIGWHYTKDGMYTVKSAYWLATHLPNIDGLPPPPGNVTLKQLLWKINTAPKLQHFCWKLLSGAIATGEMLRYRHINRDSTCKRCCAAEETTQHLFFDCEYAKATWRASGIPLTILVNETASWDDKLRAILTHNPATPLYLRHLSLWILWRLWKSRNTLTFQQKHIPWEFTIKLAKRDAAEWIDVIDRSQQKAPSHGQHQRTHRTSHWTRPPQGWKKCNYDGSFFQAIPGKAGWVTRDEAGLFVLSLIHI